MGYQKPGVNWDVIRTQYESGVSQSELERNHDVTRQSIAKRAKQEGWVRGKAIKKAVQTTETMKAERRVRKPKSQQMIEHYGLRTEQNMVFILAQIAKGIPPNRAASMCGISLDTMADWQRDDPKFKALIEEAKNEWVAARMRNLNAACQRGDTKAIQFALERHPFSREEFGTGMDGGTGGIVVQINVSRGSDVPKNGDDAIDITPIPGQS